MEESEGNLQRPGLSTDIESPYSSTEDLPVTKRRKDLAIKERAKVFKNLRQFSLTDVLDQTNEESEDSSDELILEDDSSDEDSVHENVEGKKQGVNEKSSEEEEEFYLLELSKRMFDKTKDGVTTQKRAEDSFRRWFTGKSAVDWVQHALNLESREDSQFLCQKLLDIGLCFSESKVKETASKAEDAEEEEDFMDSDSNFYFVFSNEEKSSPKTFGHSRKPSRILQEHHSNDPDLMFRVRTLIMKLLEEEKAAQSQHEQIKESLQQAKLASLQNKEGASQREEEEQRVKNLEKEMEETLQRISRITAELEDKKNLIEKLQAENATMRIKVSGGVIGDGVSEELETLKLRQEKFEWEIDPHNDPVTFDRELGRGGFAVVYKGKWRGNVVAIKKLASHLQKEPSARFIREINLMMKIRHPNVVLVMGASLKRDNMFLVMEYASKGNLHDVIAKENPSWRNRLLYARDVCRGLNYLHQYRPNPIIHRDLKSQNILIFENDSAKICDFGLAKETLNHNVSLQGSTLKWMPPEMFVEPACYSLESDIYVLGLILWEILTGLYPYEDVSGLVFIRGMQDEQNPVRPTIPPDTDPEYAQLVRECWKHKPADRPNSISVMSKIEEILEKYDEKKTSNANPRKEEIGRVKEELLHASLKSLESDEAAAEESSTTPRSQSKTVDGEVGDGQRESFEDEGKAGGRKSTGRKEKGSLWRTTFSTIIHPDSLFRSKKKLRHVQQNPK